LRAAAADMPNVRFLGVQPYERLRSLYRHAIALVVPSVCYEVFPMVILEAFAEGTPIVTRDLAGMAEMVREADGGLLFNDDEGLRAALDRMQTDGGLRRRLGENGRRTTLERWSAGPHIAKYFEIIDECRANGHAAAGRAS
jgi:glycosyltransferase involved in cell wall biosynthesis